MSETKNLGTIMALWVGTTAPTNTNLIWLDTSLTIPLHKAYNPTSTNWEAFTYLTLIDNITIKKDVDGKLYVDTITLPDLQIDDGSVTLIKLANVASGSVFYRKSAEVGVPEVQTLATLKSDLGLIGTNSGDQDLSGLVVKTLEINGYPLDANINLTSEDLGVPSGTGSSSGTNTGDETTFSILEKLGIEILSGANTGDETYNRILSLFSLVDEEGGVYTLIPQESSNKLNSIGWTSTITLPSSSTVSGRISSLIEGEDYPDGWVLSIGTSAYDLLVTHNTGRKISNISIFSVGVDNKERLLRPFNNAYSGILTESVNAVLIEALTNIQTEIKIYITFV